MKVSKRIKLDIKTIERVVSDLYKDEHFKQIYKISITDLMNVAASLKNVADELLGVEVRQEEGK